MTDLGGTARFSGKLTAKLLTRKVGWGWKLRNLPNRIRGLPIEVLAKIGGACGVVVPVGRLYARLIHADKTVVDYGCLGSRMVTTVWVEDLVDNLIAEVAAFGDYKYHDTGTGVGIEAVGNVGMGTFSTEMVGDIRGVGTQIEGGGTNIYRSVSTITYDGVGGAITEHGLFNNTRAAGGILLDRHLFAAINVVATDSIQFTYELTCTPGG